MHFLVPAIQTKCGGDSMSAKLSGPLVAEAPPPSRAAQSQMDHA